MSMDKNVSTGKMDKKKLSMISATLKENVSLKKETLTNDDTETTVDVENCSEIRNAFKLMLDSRKGASSPSNSPR